MDGGKATRARELGTRAVHPTDYPGAARTPATHTPPARETHPRIEDPETEAGSRTGRPARRHRTLRSTGMGPRERLGRRPPWSPQPRPGGGVCRRPRAAANQASRPRRLGGGLDAVEPFSCLVWVARPAAARVAILDGVGRSGGPHGSSPRRRALAGTGALGTAGTGLVPTSAASLSRSMERVWCNRKQGVVWPCANCWPPSGQHPGQRSACRTLPASARVGRADEQRRAYSPGVISPTTYCTAASTSARVGS